MLKEPGGVHGPSGYLRGASGPANPSGGIRPPLTGSASILLPIDQLFAPDEGEPPRTRTAVPLAEAPLAVRMRPQTADELVGQEHLLHDGAPLRRAIEEASRTR